MPSKFFFKKDKPPIETGKRILLWLVIFVVGVLLLAEALSVWHEVSYSEGILLALETLSFLPPEATGPVERIVHVIALFFGVFLAWFLLWNTLDLIVEGKLNDYGDDIMQQMRQILAKDHTIVIGGGRVGLYTAEILEKRKQKCVIVESDEARAKTLQKHFTVVTGDGLDENVLKRAGVAKSKNVVCALEDTEKNVLITLLVKSLNPNTIVSARCEHPSLTPSLHKAGATHVILPEHAAAEQFSNIVLPLSSEKSKM